MEIKNKIIFKLAEPLKEMLNNTLTSVIKEEKNKSDKKTLLESKENKINVEKLKAKNTEVMKEKQKLIKENEYLGNKSFLLDFFMEKDLSENQKLNIMQSVSPYFNKSKLEFKKLLSDIYEEVCFTPVLEKKSSALKRQESVVPVIVETKEVSDLYSQLNEMIGN